MKHRTEADIADIKAMLTTIASGVYLHYAGKVPTHVIADEAARYAISLHDQLQFLLTPRGLAAVPPQDDDGFGPPLDSELPNE